MEIPSRQKCYQLMYDMEMMDHIVAHSIMVCKVALLLTDSLNAQGACLNRNLIQASALLHDVTKTRSIKTGENHAVTGDNLLCNKGHPEVGYIIGKHIYLDKYTISGQPSESEVVNYSDKRVLHDKVVSIEIRGAYILKRYGTNHEFRTRIKEFCEKIKLLELKLFNLLWFSPKELSNLINQADFAADISDYGKICKNFSYTP